MRRKSGLFFFMVIVAFTVSGVTGYGAGVIKYPAMLCSSCGFGGKADYCVKCGKWVGSTWTRARLCSSCGFGANGTKCVKCGKWVANTGVPAKLCGSCAFGNKSEHCVKCGRWAP